MEIVRLPTIRQKYLDTPVHTLLSFFHLLLFPCDVALVCNAANSPFIWIPRLRGIPVAVNVDGIERLRKKWNALGRSWYRLGEWASVHMASEIIADAEVIARYYLNTFASPSTVIPYGVADSETKLLEKKLSGTLNVTDFDPDQVKLFSELGVRPLKYLLYVSRLEPENNAHVVIEAYQALKGEFRTIPLVIVGDAPYASKYKERLRDIAGENIVFAGYRFGRAYQALQLGASVYIQATEVGGTHPALVEAMGFGNCVIANRTPENEEVLGEHGIFYDKNSPTALASELSRVLADVDLLSQQQAKTLERARMKFNWETITDDYETLFWRLFNGENCRDRA